MKCITCLYCKQPSCGKRAVYACFINPNSPKRVKMHDDACKQYKQKGGQDE